MFEGLTNRFGDIFDRLRKRGVLSEDDVNSTMREIRVALLEADVALPVVRDFIEVVKARAVGDEVLRSVTPGQQVVKIVNDQLVEMLGPESQDLQVRAAPPAALLMVGLQGSGKTTTTAKIGRHLQTSQGKRVMMASLDIHRPAAQQQLAVLGEQASVDTLPIIALETPRQIAKRAMDAARKQGYDVVILDTAGRLHVDDELMDEVVQVRDAVNPAEILLVADALTGQDAVNVATAFNERLSLTGIVLTRIDGDARGGAALSMKAVTGTPIRLLGTGEKLDAIEPFHPDRLASRILGMGDVVSLVEQAQETVAEEENEALLRKMRSGQLDLEDYARQIRQMRKLGGFSRIMDLMPGARKARQMMKGANIDDGMLGRQEAIISSMTPIERQRPEIIKASRKRRIAAGSGVAVQDVNALLKQFRNFTKVTKMMKKQGLLQGGFPQQGIPSNPGFHLR